MLHKNREMDYEICAPFAMHGCSKWCHIVQKYTTYKNKKHKGYAFKDSILDCVQKMMKPEGGEDKNDTAG